jgi:hypothetical protein
MNCRHYRQAALAGLAGLALLSTVSCGKAATQGKTSAYLIMDQLQGGAVTKADGTPTFSDVLRSDVVTKNSIYEDLGSVTLRAVMKDPGADPNSPIAPTGYSQITIDRYHVNYVRSDGRNTPGVDVPYGFDGAVTGTIGDKAVTLNFVLVRAQAKAEAPLMALRGMGGAMLISTIAEVTFYGRDQSGNAVSVVGRMSVNFADWADPE